MINALRNVDKYIMAVLLYLLVPLRWFSKKDAVKDPKNILFVKLWAVGDSVNTLPVISQTKKKYPNSKVVVLVNKSNAQVYKSMEFIDEIILFDISNFFRLIFMPWTFDIGFDMEPYMNVSAMTTRYLCKFAAGFSDQNRSILYNYKVKFSRDKHIVQTYINMAGCITVKEVPETLVELKFSRADEKKIAKLLSENKLQKNVKLIGICASVGLMIKEREWPKERFRELTSKILKKNNVAVILTGTKEDFELNEFIKDGNIRAYNFSGAINLGELFCLIRKMDLFISNDTGPMHIAAAQGVKTIGLFGPNTPKIWAPYGRDNVAIFHPKKGCPYLDNTSHNLVPKKLTVEQRTCMDAISVNEVLKYATI